MSIFGGPSPTKYVQGAQSTIRMGQDTANSFLDEGYARGADAYGKAGGIFGNLATEYGKGSALYQDALGVNGADGTTRARSAFTASPGYTFNMDQGMEALQRARAVNGTLASGNADTDAMKFASGLASSEYGNWLNGLKGLDAERFAASTGQAGTFGQMGNLAGTIGAAKGNIAYNSGVTNAGLVMDGYKAKQQQAQNELGGILGIANIFSGGLGALAGNGNAIGNIGKNLSSAFSIFG